MSDASKLKRLVDSWYAWQMVPGYGAKRCVPYCSPILVKAVKPKKSGKRVLRLSFINAMYAEGVQDFEADLRIVSHAPDWLIAEILDPPNGDPRAAVVSHIEFEWIREYCPSIWWNRPPTSCSEASQGSVTCYLREVFTGHPFDREA